ncbi:hypothetical protein DCC39_16095 [Pueribacillus theae]|uniref:Uncharacterized protein n=1 Tax=Pueribacillus theae TaxID=2171751 RepID=A0A2U1JRJ2_9BACI|nr:hypothetical protein [Pueribacillus theae]PWA07817.1 hypothetical protein DCC39_16095 [Pueribacillus theae]
MYKYNIFAFVFLLVFILVIRITDLYLYVAGSTFGLILIFVLPLIGAIFAFKGKGWSKWILMILNFIAFCYFAWVLIMVIGYRYFGDFAP